MDETPRKPPPFGTWPRFYLATCVVATLYIVLLAWLTAAFNVFGDGA